MDISISPIRPYRKNARFRLTGISKRRIRVDLLKTGEFCGVAFGLSKSTRCAYPIADNHPQVGIPVEIIRHGDRILGSATYSKFAPIIRLGDH
jgi:hypothetical protein